MQSDKQHIDDLFRRKEEAFTADEQHATAHWQQMQKQLADPGPGASANNKAIKQIGRFLGGLLTIAIIALLAIKVNRSNKKAITKTTKQQATVVAPQTKPVTIPDTLSNFLQPTKQAANTVPSHVAPEGKQTLPPVPAMTLFSPPITRAEEVNTREPLLHKSTNEAKINTPDAQTLLNNFFDELKKEEEVFYIQTDRDTTLIAKEGTRLFISANTLMAKGRVKILLREYYKNEDIIAAQLHTTSNGRQLVTGGMLHISAQQDGAPVTIALQKTITINMPTSKYDDRMQLFTGQMVPGDDDSSTLNWLPAEAGIHNLLHRPEHKILALNIHEVEPYSVSYRKKTTAKFYVSQDVYTPRSEIIARLKQRFGSYYDVIKLKRYRDRKGAGTQVPIIVIDSTPVDVKKVFASKKLTREDSLGFVKLVKQDSVYTYRNAKMRNTYSFAISSFGWINCDRFLDDARPKINMTVNFGNGTNANNFVSILVFTRYRSMITGNKGGHKALFKRIPEDEPALLITVTVNDDQVVSNIQSLTTSNTVIDNLNNNNLNI